jgi:hypothetical protein
MDLLDALSSLFIAEQPNGLFVNRFGLAPAYSGLISGSFILAVCMPMAEGDLSTFEKEDIIVDLLFAKLPAEHRKMIDRIRVYDSEQEFDYHARHNFLTSSSSYGRTDTSETVTRALPVESWQRIAGK